MYSRLFLAVVSCAALSACVSSGDADAIKPIASSVSAVSHVETIVVTSAPDNVSPAFKTTFVANAGERLRTCATGPKPLRLEVTITNFKKQNAALTYLAGDSNRIKGSAKLVDPASGEVVGDYEITRSTGGGGLIAAAAMSNSEADMSKAFADELCKRAFIAR